MDIKKDKKQQDFITNKLLIVFTLAFAGIFGVMYLEKMSNYANTFVLASSMISFLSGFILAILVFSAVKWFVEAKNKKDMSYKILSGKNIFFTSFVASICVIIINVTSIFTASKYIYILLGACAVLYFILVTYSKEFFVVAFSNVLTLASIYFIQSHSSQVVILTVSLVVVLVLVLMLALVLNAKKSGGKVFSVDFFGKKANYSLLMLNSIGLLVIYILSVALALYGLSYGFIIAIIYFVAIVFYNTVKLI